MSSDNKRNVVNPLSGSIVTVPTKNVPGEHEQEEGEIVLGNTNISRQKEDILYHLGLSNFGCKLDTMFGDVRFVCMGGSAVRSERFANQIAERFSISIPTGMGLTAVGKTERFSLFKVSQMKNSLFFYSYLTFDQ